MNPTTIPKELDDRYPITLDEFSALTGVSRRTVLNWHEQGEGPQWMPFNGTGRLYITAAEARAFLGSTHFAPDRGHAS